MNLDTPQAAGALVLAALLALALMRKLFAQINIRVGQ